MSDIQKELKPLPKKEKAPEGNKNHVIGAFHRMMDYLSGSQHVDNAANPPSAYSMTQRKQRNTLPRDKQEEALKKF